jgi:hypothetical protein
MVNFIQNIKKNDKKKQGYKKNCPNSLFKTLILYIKKENSLSFRKLQVF